MHNRVYVDILMPIPPPALLVVSVFCLSLSLSQFTGQASIYRAGRPGHHHPPDFLPHHRPRLDPSDASSSFRLEWSSSSTNTCNAVARTRQRVIRNVSSGGMLIVTITLSSSCSKFVRIRMRVIRNVTSGDRLNEMYFVYWHHPRATQSSGFVCALSVTSLPTTC